MTYLFLKGFIISFLLAVPVGPISLIFINRSLHQGFLIGLFTGLGIASIDAIYSAIPAFGLTYISNLFLHYEHWLKLIFGLLIFLLAIKIWRIQSQVKPPAEVNKLDYLHAYSSVFLLGLSNPVMILAYTALFIGLGLSRELTSHVAASILVISFFLGSFSWWLLFGSLLQLLRKSRLNLQRINGVNKFSAVILFGFSFWILLTLIIKA